MYIQEFETVKVFIKNYRNKGYYKKLLNKPIEIGKTYDVHWSLLKTSSKRRIKIKVKCDDCKKIIKKRICDLDINNNYHLCRSCVKKGKRNPAFGKPIHENTKKGFEKWHSEHSNPFTWPEVKQKIRQKNPWEKTGKKLLGRKHTKETLKKMRLSAIKFIIEQNGGITPRFNPKACKYFDALSKQYQWNLQHAENGGEFFVEKLGYFLDAYDKDKNIVIEYDEPAHYDENGLLNKKDIIRQEEIKEELKCIFYRFNHKTQILYEV
jgi:hypothetical protein